MYATNFHASFFCEVALVNVFNTFWAFIVKKQSVEFFCKVRNRWEKLSAGLFIGQVIEKISL